MTVSPLLAPNTFFLVSHPVFCGG